MQNKCYKFAGAHGRLPFQSYSPSMLDNSAHDSPVVTHPRFLPQFSVPIYLAEPLPANLRQATASVCPANAEYLMHQFFQQKGTCMTDNLLHTDDLSTSFTFRGKTCHGMLCLLFSSLTFINMSHTACNSNGAFGCFLAHVPAPTCLLTKLCAMRFNSMHSATNLVFQFLYIYFITGLALALNLHMQALLLTNFTNMMLLCRCDPAESGPRLLVQKMQHPSGGVMCFQKISMLVLQRSISRQNCLAPNRQKCQTCPTHSLQQC